MQMVRRWPCIWLHCSIRIPAGADEPLAARLGPVNDVEAVRTLLRDGQQRPPSPVAPTWDASIDRSSVVGFQFDSRAWSRGTSATIAP
jgi:hypothetical protein